MSIHINKKLCTGCGRCADICPGNLIVIEDHTAHIINPRDCWGCTACLKECVVGAVMFYLGADIGGRGSTLKMNQKGSIKDWIVTKPTGEQVHIKVDSSCSNAY
jgi:adenylylsulfate reductase subunit B